MDSYGPQQGEAAAQCEHSSEPSGSTEEEEFLISRGTTSFSKKASAPCSHKRPISLTLEHERA